MEIKRVGVVGAGTMGNGIAHVFARSGYAVILCDVEQRFLERGLATITKNLDREVAKNKITEADKASALKNIEGVTDRARLAECDFVVEAATEKFEIKSGNFSRSRRTGAAGGDSGFEYFIDFDHQAGGADQTCGESDRDAFL